MALARCVPVWLCSIVVGFPLLSVCVDDGVECVHPVPCRCSELKPGGRGSNWLGFRWEGVQSSCPVLWRLDRAWQLCHHLNAVVRASSSKGRRGYHDACWWCCCCCSYKYQLLLRTLTWSWLLLVVGNTGGLVLSPLLQSGVCYVYCLCVFPPLGVVVATTLSPPLTTTSFLARMPSSLYCGSIFSTLWLTAFPWLLSIFLFSALTSGNTVPVVRSLWHLSNSAARRLLICFEVSSGKASVSKRVCYIVSLTLVSITGFVSWY